MKWLPPGKYVGTKNEYIALCPETKALRLDDSRKDQFRVAYIGNEGKFSLYWNNKIVTEKYDGGVDMFKIDDFISMNGISKWSRHTEFFNFAIMNHEFFISMDQEGAVILHHGRFHVCQVNNILCVKYDDECKEPLKFQFIKA